MSFKRFSFVVFLGTITLFFSCKEKKKSPMNRGNQPVIVDVIVAKPDTISSVIEVNGTVVPNEYVELHPEISGRITYLNVPEGSYVQQGTVLARINDADLRAQLNKSKVQLELAQKTEERLRKLLDIKGLNQADYDAAVNQVSSLQADIAYTQAQIDKTYIKAPFSGVVGLRQVSPGAFVSPANVIASIQQLDKVKIDFTVPEAYSNTIKKGAAVNIRTDATQSKKDKAIILATEPAANINTRNLKVRAVLQSAKATPGAFVKVVLSSDADKKAIMVPTNAIIPDAKNDQVVLVKNGKATFTDVQTGLRTSSTIEITKGVNLGDTVVVTGVLFAKPDAKVTVGKVQTLASLTNQ